MHIVTERKGFLLKLDLPPRAAPARRARSGRLTSESKARLLEGQLRQQSHHRERQDSRPERDEKPLGASLGQFGAVAFHPAVLLHSLAGGYGKRLKVSPKDALDNNPSFLASRPGRLIGALR
jgi:hypothetical protein